jgi:hypothetical protein
VPEVERVKLRAALNQERPGKQNYVSSSHYPKQLNDLFNAHVIQVLKLLMDRGGCCQILYRKEPVEEAFAGLAQNLKHYVVPTNFITGLKVLKGQQQSQKEGSE